MLKTRTETVRTVRWVVMLGLVVALLGLTQVAFAGAWTMEIDPADAVNLVGEEHTTGVTIKDEAGERLVGVQVDFGVISGPNLGARIATPSNHQARAIAPRRDARMTSRTRSAHSGVFSPRRGPEVDSDAKP